MALLYTNENYPLPAVEALRKLGHDVLTSQDAGQANQRIPDEGVLEFAVSQQRTLITLNRRHFVRLHQLKPEHSGIIVCTVDSDFAGQAARIDSAIRNATSLAGILIRINRA